MWPFKKKAPPIDWSNERKIVFLFWRSTQSAVSNTISREILAIKDVNEPLIMIEYIDRHAVEIIVSGGSDGAIAEAILDAKPLGIWALGNTEVGLNFMTVPYKIKFTRPHAFYAVSP